MAIHLGNILLADVTDGGGTSGSSSAVLSSPTPPADPDCLVWIQPGAAGAVSVQGQATAASTTVTLPTHQVGDLIIIVARRASNTAATIPSTSGTVPAWTTVYNATGANTLSHVVAYTIATASNHTSGTWTNANHLVALVLRNPNGAGFTIGGSGSQSNSASTTITMPTVTGQTLPAGGTDLWLTFISKAGSSSVTTTIPTGQTQIVTATNTLTAAYQATSNLATSFTQASSVATLVTRVQIIAKPLSSTINFRADAATDWLTLTST